MKYFILPLVSLFLFSCGGSRYLMRYDFNFSKYQVEKDFLKVINNDTSYRVPRKWEGTNIDSEETFCIYFKNNPEEMYKIGFADSASWNDPTTSRLALIDRFDGNIWKYRNSLSSREIKRITKRFEDEIFSKMIFNYENPLEDKIYY